MSKAELLADEAAAIRRKLLALVEGLDLKPISPARQRAVDGEIRRLISELEAARSTIDPVAHPTSVFDPSNPKVVGRFTALALVAQPRNRLAELAAFYGSGVYALYYRGKFPLYGPLSGSETPIYVGKAGPAMEGARTPQEQGKRLSARLNEHRKNIEKASASLDIADFDARFLVVQSGWEQSAEDYLISLFRPIWNNEVDILYGLGKHGDSATTRANKRSPWDSTHPGRPWAKATREDARSAERIAADVTTHFGSHPVFRTTSELLDTFLAELRQL